MTQLFEQIFLNAVTNVITIIQKCMNKTLAAQQQQQQQKHTHTQRE